MLHVLLCILKIVGWILLVILGIIIVVVGIFLFEPIRYQIRINIEENPKTVFANLKFSWLFRLIRGEILYDKEEVVWTIKVAWKSFPGEEEEEFVSDLALKHPTPKDSSDQKESIRDEKEKVEEKTEEKKEKKKKEKTEKTEKIARKKDSKKIQEIFEKIKYTFQKICATIKLLQRKKEYILRFLKNDIHKRAWKLCVVQLKKLLHRMKPKKIVGSVEYGTEDPAFTGKILALISMIYPFTGEQIEIIPDFDEKRLNADVCVKGKIRSVFFLCLGVRLIMSKEIRITYKHIRKLLDRM